MGDSRTYDILAKVLLVGYFLHNVYNAHVSAWQGQWDKSTCKKDMISISSEKKVEKRMNKLTMWIDERGLT